MLAVDEEVAVEAGDELGPGGGLRILVDTLRHAREHLRGQRVDVLVQEVDDLVGVAVVAGLELPQGPLTDGAGVAALTDGSDENGDLHVVTPQHVC